VSWWLVSLPSDACAVTQLRACDKVVLVAPMMIPKARLRRVGVPEEVVDWVSDSDDPDEDWDACERPDWLVWLAAIGGVALEPLLETVAQVVQQAVLRAGEGAPSKSAARLEEVFRWVCEAQSVDEGAAALVHCEGLGGGAPQSYRSNEVPGYSHAVSAVTWLAHATAALAAAYAVDEAQRLTRGLELGGTIGVPPALVTPAAEGPARFDVHARTRDMTGEQIALAVAAASEAVRAATLALAPGFDREALEQAEAHLADQIHDVLSEHRRVPHEA